MNLPQSRQNPFNDYQYIPSSRPPAQTQRAPLDSYYFSSQAPRGKKEYGMYSKRYLPKQSMNISRSRVSNNSTMGGMMGEEKLYSEEMLFLLGEEENNMKYFKEKVEGEKQRVARDFDNLKRQISHLIEDMQISFSAELDLVYKDFIARYRSFKQHMVNLREIRRSLLSQLPPSENDYLTQLNQSKNVLSNRDLLGEIEKDAQLFRTQKVYNQITDLQREHVVPAKELAAEIVALGGIEAQFYDENRTNQMIRGLVQVFSRQSKQAYPDIHDGYVRSADFILNSGQEDVLNALSQYQKYEPVAQEEDRSNFRSADHKDIIKSFHTANSIRKDQPQREKVEREPKKYVRPVSSSSDFAVGITSKQSKAVRDEEKVDVKKGRNYHMGSLKSQGASAFRVGPEQQNVSAEWIEDVSLREVGVIQAQQCGEAMLCGVFACEGKVLVVGGKDKAVRVYEVASGKMLYVLAGHQANVCSLANHGQVVSSGGDHGCSSLIIWDSRTWTIRSRVQLHTAAVTCIVDLQDSAHLATASYDKKVNIFSLRRGTVLLTASSRAGIACMGLTCDRQRLISSSLDNSIAVWKLTRDGTNITNLQQQRQFVNESLVCSLRPFALRSNYFLIGTKDGRLQIINCLTGETIRKLSVATAPIVEVLLFQRETKTESPIILSCSPKQKSLMISKTENGATSLIDVKGRLNVEIGCGIGPKLVISQGGMLAIVSQSSMAKQVLIYQIGLL